jgi:hypothetical protein
MTVAIFILGVVIGWLGAHVLIGIARTARRDRPRREFCNDYERARLWGKL